ncbi:MAG: hypothetical protein QOJ69_1830 [Actinomycetota bacterium]|jgi:hypothetical protein|nr:hypothetical protein [Actinomycetota bacterium]
MTLLLLILLVVLAVALFGGFGGRTIYRRRPRSRVVDDVAYDNRVVEEDVVVEDAPVRRRRVIDY